MPLDPPRPGGTDRGPAERNVAVHGPLADELSCVGATATAAVPAKDARRTRKPRMGARGATGSTRGVALLSLSMPKRNPLVTAMADTLPPSSTQKYSTKIGARHRRPAGVRRIHDPRVPVSQRGAPRRQGRLHVGGGHHRRGKPGHAELRIAPTIRRRELPQLGCVSGC